MTHLDDFCQQFGPATARTYRRSLEELARLAGGDLTSATQGGILRYQASIDGQAPATQARKLSAASVFFGYLVKRRIRPDNPTDAILHRPHVDRLSSRRWLSLDQQRAVLAAVEDAREAALLALLIGGGLRAAEVCEVNAEDWAEGVLHVRGKGNKSRFIPLPEPMSVSLTAYLGRRRSGPLLVGRQGRMTPRQVQRLVAGATLRALGEVYNAHSLRHGFGNRHAQSGTPLAALQALMGHAALSSTQVYLHTSATDLQEAVRRDPLSQPAGLHLIEQDETGAANPSTERAAPALRIVGGGEGVGG
jgi:site-specific recombinase XerD